MRDGDEGDVVRRLRCRRRKAFTGELCVRRVGLAFGGEASADIAELQSRVWLAGDVCWPGPAAERNDTPRGQRPHIEDANLVKGLNSSAMYNLLVFVRWVEWHSGWHHMGVGEMSTMVLGFQSRYLQDVRSDRARKIPHNSPVTSPEPTVVTLLLSADSRKGKLWLTMAPADRLVSPPSTTLAHMRDPNRGPSKVKELPAPIIGMASSGAALPRSLVTAYEREAPSIGLQWPVVFSVAGNVRTKVFILGGTEVGRQWGDTEMVVVAQGEGTWRLRDLQLHKDISGFRTLISSSFDLQHKNVYMV
ncbi:hypothetical protein FA13DRAFT_1709795 [Coprinellus micaceus]|uniref:Uncharacterized protein n=1 Tax=Coprinellus micaceus TaxID=71717 RepID=A0A4Y7TBN2_COPMI|nr:hypothetical protein FA13DRAFT_1709795 [Coprinellus micaceus]